MIIAGKGHDVCTIDDKQQEALTWKKALTWESSNWGIAVPSCRLWG